jgi:hypothetical protein
MFYHLFICSRATPELADMFSKIFKPTPSERASVVGAQLMLHVLLHCRMLRIGAQ